LKITTWSGICSTYFEKEWSLAAKINFGGHGWVFVKATDFVYREAVAYLFVMTAHL
jgi:hypothetical protein